MRYERFAGDRRETTLVCCGKFSPFLRLRLVGEKADPRDVLAILAERMEKRATTLEGVKMEAYSTAVDELRRFADMIRKAREYLSD